MSDETEGLGLPGPSATHKRTVVRGASGLDVRIYQAVLDAGARGLTAAEIHDRVRDVPGFDTDTKAWWEQRPSRKSTFSLVSEGRGRVRQRITGLVGKRVLVSDFVRGTTTPGEARYTAGSPPKGYRRKHVAQNPHGWFDIDVTAEQQARRRQITLVTWHRDVEAELAKAKPRGQRLRELLETARQLLS